MGEFHGQPVSPAYDYRATHITAVTNINTTTQNATSGAALRYVQLASNTNVFLGMPLVIDTAGSQETIFVASIANINTTGSAIASTGSQTCTPASMAGIVANMALTGDVGGSKEVVVVASVTLTTFTATFANTHSNGFAIVSTAIGATFAKSSHSSGVAVTGDTYPAVAPDAVSTFSPTSITAGAATIQVGSLTNISGGARLRVSDGTNWENFNVSSVSSANGTLTATFLNSYTAPLYLTTSPGTWVGIATVNGAGTSPTLILYDGDHADPLMPASNSIATVVDPAQGQWYPYWCKTVNGPLCYKYTGAAAGDITVTAMSMPV